MVKQIKQKLEAYLAPRVAHLPISPNTITIVSIIPPLLFLIAVINHAYFLALLALLGTLFDGLDGIVARAQNKVSAFGGFLDSTIDRLADSFIIVAFSFGGVVKWEITLLLLIFTFLISYTRSRGELASKQEVTFDVGLIKRPQRIIIIFLSLLLFILFPGTGIAGFNLLEICLTILTFLSAYTVLERILYAYKKL